MGLNLRRDASWRVYDVSILWNGTYFNYDVGNDYKTDIMAEQFAGQWYANLTGLGEIAPAEMRRSALQHVFDFNVMKSQNGAIGVVKRPSPGSTAALVNIS